MKLRFIFIIIILLSNVIISQEAALSKEIDGSIKIYLDCWDCDPSFFRQNLELVNFVRDSKLADIHILVTRQRTASASTEYGINFIGNNKYSDIQFKLKTVSPQFESDINRWERLLKTIEIGILPYLTKTQEIGKINITYNGHIDDQIMTNIDPWNYWVFRLGLSSEIDIDENKKEYSFHNFYRADRITEIYKFRSNLFYNIHKELYTDDDEIIESINKEAAINSEIVYSLSPKWSLGFFGGISSSSFRNFELNTNFGPAIEYNIFPWDSSDRKIFTIGYFLKSNYFKYYELTIFNRSEEWRISESLRLSLILRQTWGEIENTLEGSHYFFDFSKNRLSLRSNISVNLFKGLSVFFRLRSELIHDQLYLQKGEATRDELLLQQRELATAYEISFEIGIRYTFGSIYNNIVNYRL